MRGRKTCRLCSTRKSVPVGVCANCNDQMCAKHLTWHENEWWCTKCVRREESSGFPTRDT